MLVSSISTNNMDFTYVKRVQEWVELDNQVLRNKELIKDVTERKKQLEEDILEYVETNKLDSLCLNISDGTIKFGKRSSTQPLSIKYIRQTIEKYAEEKSLAIDVNELCDYISSNLEKKTQTYLKRDIK